MKGGRLLTIVIAGLGLLLTTGTADAGDLRNFERSVRHKAKKTEQAVRHNVTEPVKEAVHDVERAVRHNVTEPVKEAAHDLEQDVRHGARDLERDVRHSFNPGFIVENALRTGEDAAERIVDQVEEKTGATLSEAHRMVARLIVLAALATVSAWFAIQLLRVLIVKPLGNRFRGSTGEAT